MSVRRAAVAETTVERRQGTRESAKPARPRLGVVDRRRLLERARRRQARVLVSLSAGLLASALVVAAAAHAFLADEQLSSDALQSQVANALAHQQNLQLERAELSAPSRVLSIAERRFKMIAPGGVQYLAPVKPGETVEQAHAAADTRAASSASRASATGAHTSHHATSR